MNKSAFILVSPRTVYPSSQALSCNWGSGACYYLHTRRSPVSQKRFPTRYFLGNSSSLRWTSGEGKSDAFHFAVVCKSVAVQKKPKAKKTQARAEDDFQIAQLAVEAKPASDLDVSTADLGAGRGEGYWVNRALVGVLVGVIDNLYNDRPYARFYVLETVARVPYFAYVSVLHLYETLGWWRRADWLKVHFAQSWNEMHHLLIMEDLGGHERWRDQFIAKHGAIVYFWLTAVMFALAPAVAYNFAELVEAHAYHSYDKFLNENADQLKKIKAPKPAVDYYNSVDPHMFDAFHTDCLIRRPQVATLYDVFMNIRDDEAAHFRTLVQCQDPDAQQRDRLRDC